MKNECVSYRTSILDDVTHLPRVNSGGLAICDAVKCETLSQDVSSCWCHLHLHRSIIYLFVVSINGVSFSRPGRRSPLRTPYEKQRHDPLNKVILAEAGQVLKEAAGPHAICCHGVGRELWVGNGMWTKNYSNFSEAASDSKLPRKNVDHGRPLHQYRRLGFVQVARSPRVPRAPRSVVAFSDKCFQRP